MRINPYPMPDLLAAIAQTENQQTTALLELASGRKINSPSDDPVGSAVLVQNHDLSARDDSFLKSAGNVTGVLQSADSALGSAVSALQRAISLGVEGGTGTLSDSDRTALAGEVTGIRDQILSLANLSYDGRYVFAGTANVQPYVTDSSAPSGVSYKGNTSVNTVAIGNGYRIQINVPGSQIFSGTGGDVFQSLSDLAAALQNNSGIDTAVTAVTDAFNYVTAQRVFYGNAVNQITSQQTYLNSEKLQLSQQEDTLAGADLSAVATQLVNAQNARTATLSAVGKISQLSLFDYLK